MTVALVGLGLAAGTVPGQEEPPTFGEAVEVRVVNVDVYVTDKRGRRVADLGREDFLLFQDNQPVEVTNFSRIAGGSVAASSEGEAAAMELDAGGEGSEPLPAVPDPLTVVIFVDNSTLTPPHRNRVLGELESFMSEQMASGVGFMIAVFNPGLEILTPVTTDVESAREALAEIARMPASGLSAITDRRQAMEVIQDVYELFEDAGPGLAGVQQGFGFDPCVSGWERMVSAVDSYSEQAGARIANVQAGLVGLTRSLGGVPGRKALLYLSDGLEQRPGIDLYGFLGELCPRREREMFSYVSRWDGTPLLQELTEYANAHRVTLYALETTGLTGYSAASVEYASKRFMPSARNDELRVSNLQSSLFLLSDETGGRALLNTNFPEAELDRVAEDFSDYYSLGFEPPTGWDGKSHTIRVALVEDKAKGHTLRYRQRYHAVPESERLAERTLATLVLGWEDNPLGTEIRIGEQTPGAEKAWQVPVEIVLPRERLGTLARRGGENQLIRVLMMAEDEKSRRTPMREKLIPLELADPESGEDAASAVIVTMELAPGRHTIAIGVRDEINRVASFHRAVVEVAATAPGGASGP